MTAVPSADAALARLRAQGPAVELIRELVGGGGVNIDALVPPRAWRLVLAKLDREPWRYRIGGSGLWRILPVVGYLWPDGSQLFVHRRITAGPFPPRWFAQLGALLLAGGPDAAPEHVLVYLAVQALRPGRSHDAARRHFAAAASDPGVVRAATVIAAECRLAEVFALAMRAAQNGQWRGVPHRDGRDGVARVFRALAARVVPAPMRAALAGDLGIGQVPVTARIAGVETSAPPGVFVPTPDADALVDLVLNEVSAEGEHLIVDCGTGNGALALGVASHRPRSHVLAVDVDKGGLRAARRAARRAGVANLTVLHGSLLEPLPTSALRRVDVLVANLPFYPPQRRAAIGSVAESTIVGLGADGLGLYRALLSAAEPYLADHAVVVLQMFADQWATFTAELPSYGLRAMTAITSGPFVLAQAARDQ